MRFTAMLNRNNNITTEGTITADSKFSCNGCSFLEKRKKRLPTGKAAVCKHYKRLTVSLGDGNFAKCTPCMAESIHE